MPDAFLESSAVGAIVAGLAPRYRVMSISPRRNVPYQVSAMDLMAMLDQFGLPSPILVGERAGCLTVLLVAAWYPGRVGGLVLVDPEFEPPPGETVEARALGDCPPDWPALRSAVTCPVCAVRGDAQSFVREIDAFASALR